MAEKEKENDIDEVAIDDNNVVGVDNNDNEFYNGLNKKLACNNITQLISQDAEQIVEKCANDASENKGAENIEE